MDWNKLKQGICPNIECDEVLKQEYRKVVCNICNFQMRRSKYDDLIKGKESNAYKRKVAMFNGLKKRAKRIKEKKNKWSILQNKEVEFNRKKLERENEKERRNG